MNSRNDSLLLSDRDALIETLIRQAERWVLIAEWLEHLPLEDVLKIPDRTSNGVPLAQGTFHKDLDEYEYGNSAPEPLRGLRVRRSLVQGTLRHCSRKNRAEALDLELSTEVRELAFVTEDLSRPLTAGDVQRLIG